MLSLAQMHERTEREMKAIRYIHRLADKILHSVHDRPIIDSQWYYDDSMLFPGRFLDMPTPSGKSFRAYIEIQDDGKAKGFWQMRDDGRLLDEGEKTAGYMSVVNWLHNRLISFWST